MFQVASVRITVITSRGIRALCIESLYYGAFAISSRISKKRCIT